MKKNKLNNSSTEPSSPISLVKRQAMIYKLIKIIMILIGPIALYAQTDNYPPGTVQMTPQIDLELQPVELIVPDKFASSVPPGLILNLPPDFTVKVFATTGLQGPRLMAWNQQGVLHVANMKANGADEFEPSGNSSSQIVALPDWDGDGVADTAIVAAEPLRWANSLAFYEGHMYVADTHQIVKFSDLDGDLVYEERQIFADNIPTASTPHLTRTIVVDAVSGLFYLSVGSTCDVCRERNEERATVLQFNADGTGRRIFATGLRNAVGLDLHPLTRELWATNNGHSERVNTLPPEWIDIVRDGGFYGWPFAYAYQAYIDFSRTGSYRRMLPLSGEDSLLVESMTRPVALVDAHVAPMGIHFYAEDSFPSQYRNAAFVAYRAGFRGPDPGHKIVALFSAADGSNVRVGDFLTGFWSEPPNKATIWGNPVGVTSDQDGSLYLTSDWINHLVLKVEYQGDPTTAVLEEPKPSTTPGFFMEQNYPNPFNSNTVIHFSLLAGATVELAIYDLAGQKVTTLLTGMHQAGAYRIDWDGRDDNGRELASGLYLYRLRLGALVQTRKLVLLR